MEYPEPDPPLRRSRHVCKNVQRFMDSEHSTFFIYKII